MDIFNRLGAESHLYQARKHQGGYGINCPNCSTRIEIMACYVCPSCGHQIEKRGPLWKRLLLYLGALLIFLFLASVALFLLQT